MRLIKVVKNVKKDGVDKKYTNFFLEYELEGDKKYIAVRNSFQHDYSILNDLAIYVDLKKGE